MRPFSLCIGQRLLTFEKPAVMGIINATPDSFFSGSRAMDACEIAAKAETMLGEGADFIDIGAYSTRPGHSEVLESEELRRLETAIAAVRKASADVPISVDTFRSKVAETAITSLGADIINDISGGELDPAMMETAARLQAPYIMMHLGSEAGYADVAAEALEDLARKVAKANLLGINDAIVDPGFWFNKTVAQNYELLRNLDAFASLACPVLVGLSRKSMLCKPLGISPAEALPATTAANAYAVMRGASILRVHDVAAARQAIEIASLLIVQHPQTAQSHV